jgi:hypothetical protein
MAPEDIPSRLSTVDGEDRVERDRLFAGLARAGFTEHYRGLRGGKSGERFWIEDTTVRNLVDADGVRHGQAEVIRAVAPA